jgi:hypothetical protein
VENVYRASAGHESQAAETEIEQRSVISAKTEAKYSRPFPSPRWPMGWVFGHVTEIEN